MAIAGEKRKSHLTVYKEMNCSECDSGDHEVR